MLHSQTPGISKILANLVFCCRSLSYDTGILASLLPTDWYRKGYQTVTVNPLLKWGVEERGHFWLRNLRVHPPIIRSAVWPCPASRFPSCKATCFIRRCAQVFKPWSQPLPRLSRSHFVLHDSEVNSAISAQPIDLPDDSS